MTAAVDQALRYRFRVRGHLDDHWAGWLGDLTLTRNGDGTTTLTGLVVDQARLHGVLAGLRDIGTTLLDVHVDEPPTQYAPPVLDHVLRTDRLTLRPATPADAESTYTYRRLETVGRWLTEVPTGLDGYRTTFSDPSRLATTVIVECNHQVIGDFMLRVDDAWAQAEVADQARNAQAELGWVLDPAHTGHGYATEAVRALLEYSFSELGIRRVVANCFLANDSSWRLMERLGMRRETHVVRESLHRSGEWLDTVAYAVLAEEWTGTASAPVNS
jgi:RimJ/RimL family protein N-acetyltransferase